MHFSVLATALAVSAVAGTPLQSRASMTKNLHGLTSMEILEYFQAKYEATTLELLVKEPSSCTPENIGKRQEWSALSTSQKQDYISAIECLHTLPAQTPPDFAPGAVSRWDDFVVAHALQTPFIHVSGFLLPWHRHFVWMIEQALRNECGYKGYQPYWDWSRWADKDPSKCPLYDGSSNSLSGNGKPIPHNTTYVTLSSGDPPPVISFPPGSGGGCLYQGPLVNWNASLGPYDVINGDAGPPNPQANGLGKNPRCLQRDFYPPTLLQLAGANVTATGLMNFTSIHTFHPYVETTVHPAGHGFIGGDNHDLFISPNDPLFFFHHAQLDHYWTVWQSGDYNTRTYAYDGTQTDRNYPPSPNVTGSTPMVYSPIFPNVTTSTVMSAISNGYCYMYV